jgi:radical SAM superfamily enzyme YgiQ (UPF0313 family)
MAPGDTDVGLDGELFLSPGFVVSVSGAGISVFPQLSGPNIRRAPRGAIVLVSDLSRGDGRPARELIQHAAELTGGDPAVLERFVTALRTAGLVGTDPAPPVIGPGSPTPTAARPVAADTVLTLVKPAGFLVEDGAFVWLDHDGRALARLSTAEFLASTAFGTARTVGEAAEAHVRARPRVPADDFAALVERLVAVGLVRPPTQQELAPAAPTLGNVHAAARAIVEERVAAAIESHWSETASHAGHRIPVVPVNTDHGVAPLSLALLVASAREHEGGRLRERYDFVPSFLTEEQHLLELAHEPTVFIFSNYVWNVDRNLALSELVKQANPHSITVHGGPSTPKYEADTEVFFGRYQHIDVAVHGEGESTFNELLDAIDAQHTERLDVLRDVAGLTYRAPGGGVTRTADRERIVELDTIPSPYLLGLLDSFGAAQAGAIIETNRGCPYGCTFCDWGSATLSRIRKFSLDRVFAELEWSAAHSIEIASIADANFGIMERDVEIAQKIADLKRTYGYPRTVATNYAKNTVKYLREIIEIFADVEILTEGVVSLQSMDEPTLKIIRRSNIKLERYNELSTEFRRARLPLAADIMMGLPGSTPKSFRNDLQQCTNRDVRVRANPTQLLPNSPMNDPEYRREHEIIAEPGEILMQTASYTRAEWDDMNGLRRAFYAFDNWGVLRYLARFVRQETGLHEVDFYDRVRSAAQADRARWPMTAATLDILESYMAPPASWGLFVDEVGRFVVDELGVADDSALRVALAVQLAHLPAPGRTFPMTLELEHDFGAWQDALLAARESDHRDDWEHVVPRLETYPPTQITIADPNDICSTDVGKPMGMLGMSLRSWELDSPIARPRLGVVTAAG